MSLLNTTEIKGFLLEVPFMLKQAKKTSLSPFSGKNLVLF